jgi:hypothetical protein
MVKPHGSAVDSHRETADGNGFPATYAMTEAIDPAGSGDGRSRFAHGFDRFGPVGKIPDIRISPAESVRFADPCDHDLTPRGKRRFRKADTSPDLRHRVKPTVIFMVHAGFDPQQRPPARALWVLR